MPIYGLDYVGNKLYLSRAYDPGGGLVHREDDTAPLRDFGLARSYCLQLGLSSVDMMLGTPADMRREQALVNPTNGQTDVYSLDVAPYSRTMVARCCA